ncbi:MAG TPA: TMEM175 family protein [Candidatus Acidoferrales bacterium]|nr:TMEM175 family protein [Candidatus Acidoferrales bacterium]
MPSNTNSATTRGSFASLFAFSQSLIAVSMTVLVFALLTSLSTLHFPLGEAQVETVLAHSVPQFGIFVLSFVVIGSIWIDYHEIFNEIRRYSRGLVWLNFLFLMFVVFIPFATVILGGSADSWLAVVFYAAIIAGVGFSLTLLWVYASHNHHLIDPSMSARAMHSITMERLVTPSVFLFSVFIAPYSQRFAELFWLVALIGGLVIRLRSGAALADYS